MEHYVTLFDSHFLPSGLCLHDSLMKHASSFTLWVVCMDKEVERQLISLNLSNIKLISIESAENERLLSVKADRTKGEYCWTMTPFVAELVLELVPEAKRVTYLDADLFFYDDPAPFFDEFEKSQKKVLITEHAFAPEYAQWEALSGRFCVQFLTFTHSIEALEVMRWWQDACIDWCYARIETERFGDQKYLNKWPTLFEKDVHILQQKNRTLAPWNVSYYMQRQVLKPVFYHFHSLRIVGEKTVRLYEGYKINKQSQLLYQSYIEVLEEKLALLKTSGIGIPLLPEKLSPLILLRRFRDLCKKTVKYKLLKY
jgi:hypothetical protein